MGTEKRFTERGFRVFAGPDNVGEEHCAAIRVQESSRAGDGPHVWLFPLREHPELSLDEAKAVVRGLQAFISEAEAGLLTEAP